MDDLQYMKMEEKKWIRKLIVLNLVINGWPSILNAFLKTIPNISVLNLVINGWPSILNSEEASTSFFWEF